MEKSFKFKHIETNLLSLLTLFLGNENIKKYIYYLVDNPLSQPNVTIDLVEDGYVVLTMFDESYLTEDKIRVFFYPYQGSFKSYPLGNITYVMDIIVPNKKWVLEGLGELRIFRICDEFAQLIDQQTVAGIGEVSIAEFKSYKVGKNYSGSSIFVKVNTSSLKGLR